MVWLIRQLRTWASRTVAASGRLAGRRGVAPAIAAAAVVLAATAGILGAGLTDLLMLLTLGAVVAGVAHGHRQRRLILDELRRQARRQDIAPTLASTMSEVRDRQKLTDLTLGRLSEDLATSTAGTRRLIRAESRRVATDLDALAQLRSLSADGRPSAWLGPSRPEAAMLLIRQLRSRSPKTAVVCGDAGLAVWCAIGLGHLRMDARVVALDHDGDRVSAAERSLAELDLAHRPEIRLTALERYRLHGTEVRWYARAAWTDLVDAELVAVAGPLPAPGGEDELPAPPPVLSELVAAEGIVVVAGVESDDPQLAVLADELSMRLDIHGPTTAVLARG